MEEIIDRVKDVQERLFEMDDSDGPGLKPYDELEILSDLPSYPSVILEKLELPLSDSEEEILTEQEDKTTKQTKPTKNTKSPHIIDDLDDFSEIPPDPPIKLAPSYAIPIKVTNFLVPDLTKYSTATILILKGRDFPQTKSGVRSSYITFQFDSSLPVIQSPVCYNHEQEADYNGGFNIDISKVNVNNALPIIEAYDIISNKHQDLIGFNAIQFQHSCIRDNYLVVVENEWIQLFMPHCRKKAGAVLISLYLHNGNCPAIPKQPKQENIKKNSPTKSQNNASKQTPNSKTNKNQPNNASPTNISQNNELQHSYQRQNVYNEHTQIDIPGNSSSLPVKGNISQTINNQTSTNQQDNSDNENVVEQPQQKEKPNYLNQISNSFIPKPKKKLPDLVVDEYYAQHYISDDDEENGKVEIKSDFMFKVEDNELIDTLSLDVLHPFSWSKLAKRKRILRWMDTDDLEIEYTEEAETQTDFPTKNKFTQTGQKEKEVKFSKTVSFGNKKNQDNTDLFRSAPIKLPVIDNSNQNNGEAGSDPEEKPKNENKDYTYPRRSYNMDDIQYNLFNRDDEFVGYSDYGLFAHKLLDEL